MTVKGGGDTLTGLARKEHQVPAGRRGGRRSHPQPQDGDVQPTEPPKTMLETSVDWDPNSGERCLTLRDVPGDPASAEGQMATATAFGLVFGGVPICTASPAATPSRPTPGVVAQLLWEDRMVLARPGPRIQPGKAICGMDAYLEIDGEPTQSQTFDAFGHRITLTAHFETYDVDWGDGEKSLGVSSLHGGPWPDGDIRHVYTDKGNFDVRVTKHWSGTWSMTGAAGAGANSGGEVAGTLFSEGLIEDFPVVEVQAVRVR